MTVPFELKDPPNFYADATFLGGEPIHVEVVGGTIGGFTDDFTVPLGLLVTSPAPEGETLVMHRGQDLSLTWDRGQAGVFFYVQGTARASSGETDSIRCYFPSQDGHGRIADAIFSGFDTVHFQYVLTVTQHQAIRADYNVITQVAFLVLDPKKNALSLEYR